MTREEMELQLARYESALSYAYTAIMHAYTEQTRSGTDAILFDGEGRTKTLQTIERLSGKKYDR